MDGVKLVTGNVLAKESGKAYHRAPAEDKVCHKAPARRKKG